LERKKTKKKRLETNEIFTKPIAAEKAIITEGAFVKERQKGRKFRVGLFFYLAFFWYSQIIVIKPVYRRLRMEFYHLNESSQSKSNFV
jgi:hypothetical protein